jgi:hypothetical protein
VYGATAFVVLQGADLIEAVRNPRLERPPTT